MQPSYELPEGTIVFATMIDPANPVVKEKAVAEARAYIAAQKFTPDDVTLGVYHGGTLQVVLRKPMVIFIEPATKGGTDDNPA